MKKFILIAMIFVLALSLVACSDDGAPDGMQSVTVEGEPFSLYVPTTWTSNIASGISSAYITVSDTVIVSARYYTPASDMALSDYVTETAESYAEGLCGSFTLVSRSATVLGGLDAEKLAYTFTDGGVEYMATQYFVKHGGDMVTLGIYATGEAADIFSSDIESIVKCFTLREKTAVTGDALTDKDTPEGMKIASSDVLEYRFYVPMSWICSSESGISEAYYPESDKTNVTVTSYSPASEMTLEEYFEKVKSEYSENICEFSVILENREKTVAEKSTIDLTFGASYGERDFVVRQVMLYSSQTGLFYNITYTATADSYELHIGDFEAMLDSFIFR